MPWPSTRAIWLAESPSVHSDFNWSTRSSVQLILPVSPSWPRRTPHEMGGEGALPAVAILAEAGLLDTVAVRLTRTRLKGWLPGLVHMNHPEQSNCSSAAMFVLLLQILCPPSWPPP